MNESRQPWPGVSATRRTIMQANKGKDTKPEITVRRLLHSMGYRFRLHRRDLPGTPDIVLPARRKVIQVHGCFWHQRQEYWLPKLTRNKERDTKVAAALKALGWQCATVWECELADLGELAARLTFLLGQPGRPRSRRQAGPGLTFAADRVPNHGADT